MVKMDLVTFQNLELPPQYFWTLSVATIQF
jgi:hypothetical protein